MSILGRRKGKRRAVSEPLKPRAPRAAHPPRQPTLDSPQTTLDPLKVWRTFKPNAVLDARLWLETGELPESCHFVIRERLEPWIAIAVLRLLEQIEAELADVKAKAVEKWRPALQRSLPVCSSSWPGWRARSSRVAALTPAVSVGLVSNAIGCTDQPYICLYDYHTLCLAN